MRRTSWITSNSDPMPSGAESGSLSCAFSLMYWLLFSQLCSELWALVVRIDDPDINDHLSPLARLIAERLRLFTSATLGGFTGINRCRRRQWTQEDQYFPSGSA